MGGRTQLGARWWSRRWIAALEALGWEGRLARGRTYARKGQVRSISIRPGRVDARVKGSRLQPHVVQIELPPLSDSVWEQVADALAGEARYAASLLSGEMPRTIEEAFARVGAHLFPNPQEPFSTRCTCPDWANPCKHIAAVHYLLASQLDGDPFLLFQLRGRTKQAFVAALRERRATEEKGSASSRVESGHDSEPKSPPGELPLEAAVDNFWRLGDEFQELQFNVEGPLVPQAVLKRLGNPFDDEEGELPMAELARLYRLISERAIRTAYEDVD